MGVADREYEWILSISRLPQTRIISSLYVAVSCVGREGRIVPFVVVEWVGRAILDWEAPPKPECKNMTKTIREFHSLLWFSD